MECVKHVVAQYGLAVTTTLAVASITITVVVAYLLHKKGSKGHEWTKLYSEFAN